MGTTAEKGAYLNTTKSLLKQKINNLGGSIDDNTTFRNYANQLQNVYDNLPKTSYQEGTEINLGVTSKGKLDYENGVVGIGDTYQESTKGYQLWGGFSYTNDTAGISFKQNENGSMNISGTATANASSTTIANATSRGHYKTLQAGNYIVSCEGLINGVTLEIYDTNSTNLGSVNYLVNTKTITLTEQTNIILRGRVANGTAITGTITIFPMLESGSTAHDWEKYTGGIPSPNPSYDEDINSVTGNQDVVVSGKNLVEGIELGEISSSTGEEFDGTTMVRSTNYIAYDSDTYYYASVNNEHCTTGLNLRFYNANKQYIGYGASKLEGAKNISITITTSVTDTTPKFFKFRCALSGGAITSVNDKVLITTINNYTYEPYITPTSYQLSLGDIQLNAIGDYKDELVYDVDEDKVYKNEKIGTLTIDENSTIGGPVGEVNNTVIFSTSLALENYSTDYKCNYFGTNNTTFAGDTIGSYAYNNTLRMRVSTTLASTSAQFKTWLSTHNVLVKYALATPVETEITDTTLINQVKALYNAHSNNGTTIITSNGDLPMIIKCRGLKGE